MRLIFILLVLTLAAEEAPLPAPAQKALSTMDAEILSAKQKACKELQKIAIDLGKKGDLDAALVVKQAAADLAAALVDTTAPGGAPAQPSQERPTPVKPVPGRPGAVMNKEGIELLAQAFWTAADRKAITVAAATGQKDLAQFSRCSDGFVALTNPNEIYVRMRAVHILDELAPGMSAKYKNMGASTKFIFMYVLLDWMNGAKDEAAVVDRIRMVAAYPFSGFENMSKDLINRVLSDTQKYKDDPKAVADFLRAVVAVLPDSPARKEFADRLRRIDEAMK